MTTDAIKYPTLIDHLWPHPSVALGVPRAITLAVIGSLLLTLSAKVHLPFWPVPLTMQTFVVLTLGFAYGWKLGMATVLLYLLSGALGWPVFAGTPQQGLGITYMLGTTGGYLLGFVLAAGLCGYLAARGWDRSIVRTFAALLLANVGIYAFGLLWLGYLLGWDKPILDWGLYPFLPGDLLKIALAVLVLPRAWSVIERLKQSKPC